MRHHLVDAGQAPLPLADDLRLERALPIARHLDLDLADVGQHRLRADPIPGVALVAALGRVLRVAQMILQLRFQRGLKHRLRQIGQKAARAD